MKHRPYPAYKDSGVEWLGEVPEHWEVKRLKRVLSEPLMYGANESADSIDQSNPRFIRITDIGDDGRLKEETFRSLPESVAKPYLLEDGDILLARSGATVGKCFRYDSSWGRCCFAGYLIRARIDADSVRSDFFAMCLQSSFYWDYIKSEQIQATIQNVSAERYGGFVLPIPPLGEQLAIATFLDRQTAQIDTLIQEQRDLIELLREKRQSLISEAVTRGLDPTVPMKDSGVEWLGQVPGHWTVKRLKMVAKVQTGVAKGKDYAGIETVQMPYLRVANVQDGYLNLNDVAMIEISASEVNRYLLRDGDVLMNEGGDFDKLGRGHIWRGEVDPCIHQNHVFAVRPHSVSSKWLNAYTGASPAQFYFMTMAKQSTNLASISSTNLMELSVVVPSQQEQNSIVNFLDAQTSKIDTLITEAEEAIALMLEHRAALISEAVTGKIDVREPV